MTKEKSYFLGWIAASDSNCKSNWKFCICIQDHDIKCLELLRDLINKDIPIVYTKKNMVSLTINSKEMIKEICELLGIDRGKKSHTIKFPKFNNGEFSWSFLRGYFEGDGYICDIEKSKAPSVSITSSSIDMLKNVSDFVKIPSNIYKNAIFFEGINAIDFLGKIYENCDGFA